MFPRLMLVLCCLLSVAAFQGQALAQRKTFTVGVEAIDYYPLYAGAEGEYNGYARELLDAFAASKGYAFQYQTLPVKRLFQEFLVGKTLDFKFPDNAYWSADLRKGLDVVYSDGLVSYVDGVMVLPERKGRPVSDIKILGIIGGFTPFEYLDRVQSGAITLDESNEYSSLLLKATMERVDGAYSSVAVANYQLRDVLKKPEALTFDPSLPHTRSEYRLSTLQHGAIIQEFNEFLKAEAALVAKLKEKYQAEAGVN